MKRYITGTLAVAAALLTMSFKNDAPKTLGKDTPQTFWYNSALGSNEKSPNNYQTTSVSCPSGTAHVCTIQAENNGAGKPVFSGSTNPVDNPSMYATTKRS